ncbi:MAG: cellulase family glycosylhydrolase [Reichenbachiella sp.]
MSASLLIQCTKDIVAIQSPTQSSQSESTTNDSLLSNQPPSTPDSNSLIESSVGSRDPYLHYPDLSSAEFGDEGIIDDYGPQKTDFINSDGVVALDLTNKPVQFTEPMTGFEGNRGTDGDPNRYWSSDGDNPSPWYQVDLQGKYLLSTVSLTARQDAVREEYRTDVALWASNDPTFVEYVELSRIEINKTAPNLLYPNAGTWEVPVNLTESYRYVRVQRINEKGHFNFAELSIVAEQTATLLIASAGKNRVKTDVNNNGYEKVVLNGGGSTPGEFILTSYSWSINDSIVSDSIKFSHKFAVGTHTVILTITDDASVNDHDTLTVKIKEGNEFDPNAAFVAISPWDIAKKMGRGINMGNTLEAKNGEGSWAPAAKEYYFDDYKKAGFTNIRIPIHWGIRIDNAGTIDKKFLDRVEEVIDWSLALGLVTIIDTHHEEWVINNYTGNKAKLIRIWEQVAERFKDKSSNLVFELFNEPRSPMSAANVSDMNSALLKTVRKTNPKRIAIVTGGNWGNWQDLYNVSWPDDEYLMVSLHYYEPFHFTHESNSSWSDTEKVQKDLDEILGWLKNTKGVPGFVGEFGVNHGQNNKDWGSVLKYYRTVTDACNKWTVPYSVWDDHGWFKVYDRNKRTFNEIAENLK